MRQGKPWLGGSAPDTMEMLIKCVPLQRRQSKSDIRKDRSLRGIEAVGLEVLLSDADELSWWWKSVDSAKDLPVQLAREELNTKLIPFDSWTEEHQYSHRFIWGKKKAINEGQSATAMANEGHGAG